jgi:hypothetical protein
MSRISDADVFESIWTQICELRGQDGVIAIPHGCGLERFERIKRDVEAALESESCEAEEFAKRTGL